MAITHEQVVAATRVDAIRDPVAECRQRWPDFKVTATTITEHERLVREVKALWTRDDVAHGLRDLLAADASARDVAESTERIARCALFNDEMVRHAATVDHST